MSQPLKSRGLGRGLSALLGDEDVAAAVVSPTGEAPPVEAAIPVTNRMPLTLPIGHLRPGRMQPRTSFEGLDALVESVKTFGLLQPILVRPVAGVADSYEIVAGERRWRAAQQAQLHEVPVVVRRIGDQDALQLGLIENLQRADLTPIDEAQGYRRLMEDFSQTQDEIARTVGKSRPHVANTLRLLELPAPVQEMLRHGELSAGQARALVGLPDAVALAKRAVEDKLTVRELERLSGELKGGARQSSAKPPRVRTRARSRSASRRRWGSRPTSSCAAWASNACSPSRSATSTSSIRWWNV
jgi:ParB family transcriptional regulator, chromosome partitioning protein